MVERSRAWAISPGAFHGRRRSSGANWVRIISIISSGTAVTGDHLLSHRRTDRVGAVRHDGHQHQPTKVEELLGGCRKCGGGCAVSGRDRDRDLAGATSQSQLTLAKKTNNETSQNLAEIKRVTDDNHKIAEGLKDAFDSKIGRIFDQYVDGLQRKADPEHRDEETAAEMATRALGWAGDQIKSSR